MMTPTTPAAQGQFSAPDPSGGPGDALPRQGSARGQLPGIPSRSGAYARRPRLGVLAPVVHMIGVEEKTRVAQRISFGVFFDF